MEGGRTTIWSEKFSSREAKTNIRTDLSSDTWKKFTSEERTEKKRRPVSCRERKYVTGTGREKQRHVVVLSNVQSE